MDPLVQIPEFRRSVTGIDCNSHQAHSVSGLSGIPLWYGETQISRSWHDSIKKKGLLLLAYTSEVKSSMPDISGRSSALQPLDTVRQPL